MTTKRTVGTATKLAAIKAPVRKTATATAVAAKQPDKKILKQSAKPLKKEHKVKVVRDSFTMPHSEYQKISEIKEICLQAGMHVKKSEVLRAGLKALTKLTDAQLKRTLDGLEKIKTGRPEKR